MEPEIAAALGELPEAPRLEDEGAAAAEDAEPPEESDLDRLERLAAQIVGEVPEDPEAAEELPETAAAPRPSGAAAAGLLAGEWTEARVRGYLVMLANPRLVADGKEPLTDDELDEGARIGARILSDLLGSRVESPYVALLIWAAVVFGSRYLSEIMVKLAQFTRFTRGGRRATSPATTPRTVAAPDPVPTQPATGWA